MTELKTQQNDADVGEFINAISNPKRRADCETLLQLMTKITDHPAKMWGDSIIGYGSYHYHYASGRQGDYLVTGFSPRKTAMTVYIMPGFSNYQDLLAKLGKHKHSVSCLYINKLADIDLSVLEQIIRSSITDMKKIYPS